MANLFVNIIELAGDVGLIRLVHRTHFRLQPPEPENEGELVLFDTLDTKIERPAFCFDTSFGTTAEAAHERRASSTAAPWDGEFASPFFIDCLTKWAPAVASGFIDILAARYPALAITYKYYEFTAYGGSYGTIEFVNGERVAVDGGMSEADLEALERIEANEGTPAEH